MPTGYYPFSFANLRRAISATSARPGNLGRFDWTSFCDSLDKFEIGEVTYIRVARVAVDITLELMSSRGCYMARLGNVMRHDWGTLELAHSFGSMLKERNPGLLVTPVPSTDGSFVTEMDRCQPFGFLSLTRYVSGNLMKMSPTSVMYKEVPAFLNDFMSSSENISTERNLMSAPWRYWTAAELCRLYDVERVVFPRVKTMTVDLLRLALVRLEQGVREDPRIIHGDISPRNIIERPGPAYTLIDLGHVGVGCLDFEIGNWCGAVLAGCPELRVKETCKRWILSVSTTMARPPTAVLSMCALRVARAVVMNQELVCDFPARAKIVFELCDLLDEIAYLNVAM